MISNRTISVVMPVYNEAPFLNEAIDSILNQTYTDFEFIIVNDGSTDTSGEIIKSYNDPRIKYIENTNNMGIAFSLNLGIGNAKSEFIARIDSNDSAFPSRLEKQYKFLKKNLNCGVVTSPIIKYDSNIYGKNIISGPYMPYEEIPVKLLFSNCISHTAVMIRKAALPNPVYNENSAAEDYDLWSKVIEDWDIHILKEPLMKVRYISTGLSYKEKNRTDAELVKVKIINKLGISPSKREKEIHEKFLGDINILSIRDSIAMILWLNKIYNANMSNHFFSVRILNNKIKIYLGKILSSRKKICIILYYFLIPLNVKKIKPLGIRKAIARMINTYI